MSTITVRERDAEVSLKQAQAKEKLWEVEADKERIKVEKLRLLELLLTSEIVDGGYEQKYKAVFDDSEQETIKNKIFELIHKL